MYSARHRGTCYARGGSHGQPEVERSQSVHAQVAHCRSVCRSRGTVISTAVRSGRGSFNVRKLGCAEQVDRRVMSGAGGYGRRTGRAICSPPAIFWRMRGEVPAAGHEAAGRDQSDSGLRDRPSLPRGGALAPYSRASTWQPAANARGAPAGAGAPDLRDPGQTGHRRCRRVVHRGSVAGRMRLSTRVTGRPARSARRDVLACSRSWRTRRWWPACACISCCPLAGELAAGRGVHEHGFLLLVMGGQWIVVMATASAARPSGGPRSSSPSWSGGAGPKDTEAVRCMST